MSYCIDCKIKSLAAEALTESELETLGKNCAEVHFKKGDIIMKEGAFSSNIIYLKTGLVKIYITNTIKSQITKIAKAPSFIGIPTTFHEKINQYSAAALEPTTVCFIDKTIFKEFIYKNGKFAYEIIVELCRNEMNSFKKCVNRTQKNINGRIADALIFMAKDIYGKNEFNLPLSRLEFGNFVDTSRESVCRIFSELHNDKTIEVSGKRIKILNEESLESISKHG